MSVSAVARNSLTNSLRRRGFALVYCTTGPCAWDHDGGNGNWNAHLYASRSHCQRDLGMARRDGHSNNRLRLSLALFYIFAHDRPEDINLPRFGETDVAPMPPPYTTNFVALSFNALELGVKCGTFWILTLTFAICGISSYGITRRILCRSAAILVCLLQPITSRQV